MPPKKEDLSGLTVVELKKRLTEHGITVKSGTKKAELISKLEDARSKKSSKPAIKVPAKKATAAGKKATPKKGRPPKTTQVASAKPPKKVSSKKKPSTASSKKTPPKKTSKKKPSGGVLIEFDKNPCEPSEYFFADDRTCHSPPRGRKTAGTERDKTYRIYGKEALVKQYIDNWSKKHSSARPPSPGKVVKPGGKKTGGKKTPPSKKQSAFRYRCGEKGNICGDGQICWTDDGTCHPMARGGRLKAGYTRDTSRRLYGPADHVQSYVDKWGQPVETVVTKPSKPVKPPKPPKAPRRTCADRENPLECGADEYCNYTAKGGECRSNSKLKEGNKSYVYTIGGRKIYGSKANLDKLKTAFGGEGRIELYSKKPQDLVIEELKKTLPPPIAEPVRPQPPRPHPRPQPPRPLPPVEQPPPRPLSAGRKSLEAQRLKVAEIFAKCLSNISN